MREKELRLALVCYGGISLAVYMHGITKEIWQLLARVSARVHARRPAAAADSEASIARCSIEIGDTARPARHRRHHRRGAARAGSTASSSPHAIAAGQRYRAADATCGWPAPTSMPCSTEGGGRRRASPNGGRRRWSGMPRRRGCGMVDTVVDPAPAREVRAKLSHFMRSRWFEPPFSGTGFTALLSTRWRRWRRAARGAPLIPPGLPLDLFVTVTDFNGQPEALSLHSPAEIVETEHRLVIDFRSSGRRRSGSGRSAIRPNSPSPRARPPRFPGAFPPVARRRDRRRARRARPAVAGPRRLPAADLPAPQRRRRANARR